MKQVIDIVPGKHIEESMAEAAFIGAYTQQSYNGGFDVSNAFPRIKLSTTDGRTIDFDVSNIVTGLFKPMYMATGYVGLGEGCFGILVCFNRSQNAKLLTLITDVVDVSFIDLIQEFHEELYALEATANQHWKDSKN